MPARSTSQTRAEVENSLLFPWRGLPSPRLPKIVPLILTSAAFALLLSVVQIKVAAPQFDMSRKASCLLLPTTTEGALWAHRALEGGPSLSRYKPTDWFAYDGLAAGVMQATRLPAHVYVPQLRHLPLEGPPVPLALMAKGEAVLPRRVPAPAVPKDEAGATLAPVLYPLSAAGGGGLPRDLPPWPGEIDAAMAAADWRFILRLHPAGGVAECVALTRTAGVELLESWLLGVTFEPQLAADGGWLAVGLRFNNQPGHGTESR
jgi:hypothetical protein